MLLNNKKEQNHLSQILSKRSSPKIIHTVRFDLYEVQEQFNNPS